MAAMSWRSPFQLLIIGLVRPYMVRELPGWGWLAKLVDHRWDWLWADEPRRMIRDKLHGNLLDLNLARWWDRYNYFLGRWYDLEIQLLAQSILNLGDTVVDVGANRGEFTLAASRIVGPEGKVICFDPNPTCIDQLEHHLKLNSIDNVTAHRVGLSDEKSHLVLNVPVGFTYYGTFGEPPAAPNGFQTVRANVDIGDDLLEGESPSLIKIDVEGFECHVLKGLRKTIERCKPNIVTEHIDKNLRACGSSSREVEEFMSGLGYSPYKLGLKRVRGKQQWTAELADDNHDGDYLWRPCP
jgi:FkbM family methyltransferase